MWKNLIILSDTLRWHFIIGPHCIGPANIFGRKVETTRRGICWLRCICFFKTFMAQAISKEQSTKHLLHITSQFSQITQVLILLIFYYETQYCNYADGQLDHCFGRLPMAFPKNPLFFKRCKQEYPMAVVNTIWWVRSNPKKLKVTDVWLMVTNVRQLVADVVTKYNPKNVWTIDAQ